MKWQEHLENLEELREAVYLRTYGQKNPLLEYKLEGFEIFDKLISDIGLMLTRKVLNVRIRVDSEKPKNMPRETVQASHNAMGQFSGSAQGHGMPDNVQVKRTVPKVGRNDMCPCGSGKKYKHCHGS